ncbi:hypothetical protein MUK42_01570 [Musa troglodytarum]|uniref:Uncharacterized protein n=1 Tax=Musa troglodytarum TaxID=320322 RepID=A0A9E7EM82_9LILI|nr:hypothetical protein MUK42_01570 [Musa troglodytarum]
MLPGVDSVVTVHRWKRRTELIHSAVGSAGTPRNECRVSSDGWLPLTPYSMRSAITSTVTIRCRLCGITIGGNASVRRNACWFPFFYGEDERRPPSLKSSSPATNDPLPLVRGHAFPSSSTGCGSPRIYWKAEV